LEIDGEGRKERSVPFEGRPSGVFTLGHNSRLHYIGVGRRHAGTDLLVLVHQLQVRVSPTTANSSQNWSSTRPRTPNHNAKRERCRKTPVHSVPRHHSGTPDRTRTCDLHVRSVALYPC
jgi:hypothetical protein